MKSLFLYTLSIHKKYNKTFETKIQNTEFDIYFTDDEKNIDLNIINNSKSLKIIVIKSPFTNLHSAVKKHKDDSYIISLYYFYSLKRKVLDKHPSKVNYQT